MKNYTHIKIYQTAKTLLKETTELTKNFNREYRFTIGQDLYKSIVEFIVMIYDAYSISDFKIQYKYIIKLRRQLQYINVYIRLSSDLHLISKEKYTYLTKYTNDIENQSRGWLLSIQMKLNASKDNIENKNAKV
ncbi:four helix bundle protein [bacterium]|nr:four helix bundle protein [bacterium]